MVDETVEATAGTITVAVGDDVTIGSLGAGNGSISTAQPIRLQTLG
jgi:hypothetical protein